MYYNSLNKLCPSLQEHLIILFVYACVTCYAAYYHPVYAQGSGDVYCDGSCVYSTGTIVEQQVGNDIIVTASHGVADSSTGIEYTQTASYNYTTLELTQSTSGTPPVCSIEVSAACNGGSGGWTCSAQDALMNYLGMGGMTNCNTCPCSICTDSCGCIDFDGDGVNDLCDPCPNDPTDSCIDPCGTVDSDGDGVFDLCDPCPSDPLDNCGNGGGGNPCGDIDSDGDGVNDGCDTCPNDPLDNCGSGGGNPCDDPLYEGHLNDSDGDGCNDCEDTEPDNPRLGCGQCEGDIDCDGCPDDDDDDPNDPEVTSKKCNPTCPTVTERFTEMMNKISTHLGWDFAVGNNPEPYEYCLNLQGLGDDSMLLCVDFLNMVIYQSVNGGHIRYGAASTALLTMSTTIYYAFLAVMWWRFIPRFFRVFRSL